MTQVYKQNLASMSCREKFAHCPAPRCSSITNYLADCLSLVCLRPLGSALCAGERESDIQNAWAAFYFWVWLVVSCFPAVRAALRRGPLPFNKGRFQPKR